MYACMISNVLWPAELEGQGSGTGEEGQDVGSPMKKMRMGSGLAQAREAGSPCCSFCPEGMHC